MTSCINKDNTKGIYSKYLKKNSSTNIKFNPETKLLQNENFTKSINLREGDKNFTKWKQLGSEN